ncbi:alanine racemase [Leptolyngbya sp. 7M]|uniref:alanine racemase n=1 Tax=Leptolyngbya sp. 7M TaxID=2812896 RepID=UPI001B8A8F83|nr:alanine racemase [Leptolyngbya sp. 7M]QYO66629.1 alanine racemase [Leptolyngbya sp. 7M]
MNENSAERPTKAIVDLDHLRFNYTSIKRFIGPEPQVMAIVKADAYGHGANECSKTLQQVGVKHFGVALPEEGVELRKGGIAGRIVCFGNWPGQEQMIIADRLTPVFFQIDRLKAFDESAGAQGIVYPVVIKIDTGMGRVGVPFGSVGEFASEAAKFKNIKIEGLMTHFSTADQPQNNLTDTQIRRFNKAAEIFQAKGVQPKYLDMANSPGAIVFPNSRSSLVRIGGLLYGLGGDVLPKGFPGPELKAVMSLYSKVSFIKRVPAGTTIGYGASFVTKRDSVIGTIPIGYNDGYRRGLSNSSNVLIRGKFAPVIGRVSMDWTTIDLTDIPEVNVGDRVTVIGNDQGHRILAEDIAESLNTISYEVTCGISRRVPRVYVSDQDR